MTYATTTQLRDHARALAAAFKVQLIERPDFKPEDAAAIPPLGAAICAPIIDESTYACALHELGHLLSPTGFLPERATGDRALNLTLDEERSAWEWARHYSLIEWSPLMAQVEAWAFSTYAAPPPPAPDPTRAPHITWPDKRPTAPQITWADYQPRNRRTR